MIEIDWQLTGIFAWMRSPQYRQVLRRVTRKAQKRAINEWITRSRSPSLGDRFSANAAGRLQLSERSANYRRRQRRFFGRELPYRSPTPRGTTGSGHMADLILRQKRYRVSAVNNSGNDVVTRFRITGARVLNLIRQPYGRRYREEFLRLRHPSNQADRDWIERRTAELIWEELDLVWKRQQRKVLRIGRQLGATQEAA